MGITEIFRRVLFSANKIKSSESSKQPTQLIVKLNSSLRHIIATLACIKIMYLAKVVLDLQKLGLIPKFYFEMFSLELSKKRMNFQLVKIIGPRNQKLILKLLTNRSLKKFAQVELMICLGWFSVGICKYKPDYKSYDL